MKYRLKKAVIITVVKDELAKSNIAHPNTAFLSNSTVGAGPPISGSDTRSTSRSCSEGYRFYS